MLGSHLLYRLLESKGKVRALKRDTSDLSLVKQVFSYYTTKPDELLSAVEWVEGDVLEPESLDPAFEGVKKVYHAAAFVSFKPGDRARLIRNNTEGTANVVDACLAHGIEKMLHVSSTSALGAAAPGEKVDEKMMWAPDKQNSSYSISKFHSEMEVWRGIEEGLNAVIVNPSIILGPGYWHKGSSSLFTNVYKGLKYYMNGVTGYVCVRDVVEVMLGLMEKPVSGERFIVSAADLSYRQVFALIASALGVKEPHTEATPFLAGMAWRADSFLSLFGGERRITRETVTAGNKKVFFNNSRVKKELGFEFTPVEECIRETAVYFLRELELGKELKSMG